MHTCMPGGFYSCRFDISTLKISQNGRVTSPHLPGSCRFDMSIFTRGREPRSQLSANHTTEFDMPSRPWKDGELQLDSRNWWTTGGNVGTKPLSVCASLTDRGGGGGKGARPRQIGIYPYYLVVFYEFEKWLCLSIWGKIKQVISGKITHIRASDGEIFDKSPQPPPPPNKNWSHTHMHRYILYRKLTKNNLQKRRRKKRSQNHNLPPATPLTTT